MDRRTLITSATVVLALLIPVIAWQRAKKAADTQTGDTATPGKSHASARQPQLSAQMRRFFDPPSLEQWIASGNLTTEQAERARALVDSRNFEQAVRYGLTLPDTELPRSAVLFYAWFSWSCSDREAALRHWNEMTDSHDPSALEGLLQGVAFSPGPDLPEWLKKARESPDSYLRSRLLSITGTMTLIAGELKPADFVQLSSRKQSGFLGQCEFAGNLDHWANLCLEVTDSGRLDKGTAAQMLIQLREALELQIPDDPPEAKLITDFSFEWGSLAGKVIGALPSFDGYRLPCGEEARRRFLGGLGMGLKDAETSEVVSLASSDPVAGEILWRSYVADFSYPFGEKFAARFGQATLPENLTVLAVDEAMNKEIPDPSHAKLIEGIGTMPDGHLKNLLIQRLATRFEQEGNAGDAEHWRQQITPATPVK